MSTIRPAGLSRAYTGLPVAVVVALRGGEHIPRTTSGKLVRHEIRARLRAARGSAQEMP